MKQIVLSIFALIAIFASTAAQTTRQTNGLSEDQWNDLYIALEKEDWDTAESLSAEYLKRSTEGDEAKTVERLRYMYLYSAAGRVSAGKMSFDELEKRIKGFVGKDIFLPYRLVKKQCKGGVDTNTICMGDDPARLFITATNRTATTIHDFEYIQLKEKFDFDKNDGKIAAVIGHVDSIVPNPNKSMFLVLRIYMSNAYLRVKDLPTEK